MVCRQTGGIEMSHDIDWKRIPSGEMVIVQWWCNNDGCHVKGEVTIEAFCAGDPGD